MLGRFFNARMCVCGFSVVTHTHARAYTGCVCVLKDSLCCECVCVLVMKYVSPSLSSSFSLIENIYLSMHVPKCTMVQDYYFGHMKSLCFPSSLTDSFPQISCIR